MKTPDIPWSPETVEWLKKALESKLEGSAIPPILASIVGLTKEEKDTIKLTK